MFRNGTTLWHANNHEFKATHEEGIKTATKTKVSIEVVQQGSETGSYNTETGNLINEAVNLKAIKVLGAVVAAQDPSNTKNPKPVLEHVGKILVSTQGLLQIDAETAQQDTETGKLRAKLNFLGAAVAAVDPRTITPIPNTKLVLEHIGKISDSTQGLLDVVIADQSTKIAGVVKEVERMHEALPELTAAPAHLIEGVNQGVGVGIAYKDALRAIGQEVYPDLVGKPLGVYHKAMVHANLVGRTVRTLTTIRGITTPCGILSILVRVVVGTIDTIRAGVIVGSGLAAGLLVGEDLNLMQLKKVQLLT
ncbi:hypothetical protein FB451DRAFT_1189855 [Mycena latifolia]|nr:hypothetical protein FB451DRAFT_1189855 [Mycena latifolia]